MSEKPKGVDPSYRNKCSRDRGKSSDHLENELEKQGKVRSLMDGVAEKVMAAGLDCADYTTYQNQKIYSIFANKKYNDNKRHNRTRAQNN